MPIRARMKKDWRKPSCGNRKTEKYSMTTAGVLRITPTYTVPTALSSGTGDTRKVARTVPSTKLRAADSSVNSKVIIKARIKASALSNTAFIYDPCPRQTVKGSTKPCHSTLLLKNKE